VVTIERFPQTGAHDVCINFGCGKIGVTKHGLDASQIGPAIQQMGGEGVPQNVRRKIMKDPGLTAMFFDVIPERLAG